MSFSQRKGIKPVRAVLQVDAMDADLRASLWNILHIHLWDTPGFLWHEMGAVGYIQDFAKKMWLVHFKEPITTIPNNPNAMLSAFEKHFFSCRWNEVYDFLESVVMLRKDEALEKDINFILQIEMAGYTLINRRFVDVTDPKEVAALQEAIDSDKHSGVSTHLSRALELLSDRKNPDFRNSIKESISAVEAMACLLANKDNATLSDALKVLEQTKGLHPALREGFSKLYGYTSDADGIRHALLSEQNLTGTDAKYFLLSCTSFVNYLRALSAT